MTDFRALCSELVENLERYQCWYIEDNGYGIDTLEALLRRANAALAQPELQAPTDEDVVAACPFDSFHEPAFSLGWWSAIEWMDQRYGRHGVEPVPKSESHNG